MKRYPIVAARSESRLQSRGEAHGRIQSSAIVNAANSSRIKIWVKLEIQRHISQVREILWTFREKTSFIIGYYEEEGGEENNDHDPDYDQKH